MEKLLTSHQGQGRGEIQAMLVEKSPLCLKDDNCLKGNFIWTITSKGD
jgi:hypothetical protein